MCGVPRNGSITPPNPVSHPQTPPITGKISLFSKATIEKLRWITDRFDEISKSIAKSGVEDSQEKKSTNERKLNNCEQQCINAIRRAGRKLTTTGVREALAAAKQEYSKCSVKNALAALVRAGLLTNPPGEHPRGYSLPE
jgi:hypothetical protein